MSLKGSHHSGRLWRLSLLAVAATTIAAAVPAVRSALPQAPRSDSAAAPPVAPVRTVTDTYFGVAVPDPYRYMENLKDPEVAAWFKAQNEYTRALLARIPGRAALLAQIKMYDESTPARTFDVRRLLGGRYFYQKRLATEDVPKLYMRDGLDGPEKVIVDPAGYAHGSAHWTINYYAPSFNGKYVAVGLSAGGSEDSIIHFFDVTQGSQLPETIDRAWFGNPTWRPDNHSLYYNRMQKLVPGANPAERELKSRIYLHQLGTDPENDPVVLGYQASPNVSIQPADIPFVNIYPGSSYALGLIAHGVQNEVTVYAASLTSATGPSTPWHKLFDVDAEITGFDVNGDDLYLQSHSGASRYKVLHMKLSAVTDVSRANVVLPPGEAVVRGIAVAKDALYVQELDGGIGRIARIPYGSRPQPVALPFQGSVDIASADPRVAGVLLDMASWTKAPKIYAYDPYSKQMTDTKLQPAGRFDAPEDLESIEVKAKSYDGTLVPLSIVYKKGLKLDAANPALLEGYGAYGITLDPFFDPRLLAWLEQGGVFAVAHVRGGGEYGEDWHLAGKQLTKPNTWKDFIACAEYLIANKYTSSSKLAIEGGSAGGITVGRSITERPELFAVAIDAVPMSDAVRVELSPNGPPNIPEFGSVKTEDGFKGLYEMSAYHHVKDGTKYPAIMLTTGFNDPRVISWQPGKLAARLQAATSSGKPILLRVDYDAGHGIGSTKTQREIEMADEMSFALWQFGVPAFQPGK